MNNPHPNQGHYPQFPAYTPRPGGAEHRVVDHTTLRGLKEAERLKTDGWAIGAQGVCTITFWRPKNPAER